MGTYRSAVITAAGQNLVAESLTGGKAITFSNAKTSSYAYPDGTNLTELTDLQDIVQEVQPSMAQVINDNVVQVTARFSNENVESAYLIQTLGLYAKINDGDEVLFSVIQAITPDQMPAKNPVSPTAYIFNMQTAVQQASQVTVTVDPAGSATIQDIINLQQSKSYIRVITTNIPVSNRADNTWYLYDTDTQTLDLTRYNVEMQDRNGHAYYPHTSSSIAFRPDGTTVEDALNEMGEEIEGGNGKQNLQTYTSLSQLSLVAPQTVQQVYTALPDGATAILQCTGTSVVSDVPSGVASGVIEITKIGSGSMVRFCVADGTVYFGNLSSGTAAWSKALDAEQVLDTMEAVNANNNAGVPAGAQAVKELSGDLGGCTFSVQSDGAYVTYTPSGGADPVSKKLGDIIDDMPTIYIATYWGINSSTPIWMANNTEYTDYSSGIVTIKQPGKYQIDIRGDGFAGSFAGLRVYLNDSEFLTLPMAESPVTDSGTFEVANGETATCRLQVNDGASQHLSVGHMKITKIE